MNTPSPTAKGPQLSRLLARIPEPVLSASRERWSAALHAARSRETAWAWWRKEGEAPEPICVHLAQRRHSCNESPLSPLDPFSRLCDHFDAEAPGFDHLLERMAKAVLARLAWPHGKETAE